MPFQIVRNDITKVEADAIVNTANPIVTYIRNSQNQPKRETVAAFAVGMKLTVPEAEKLYEAAGYVLTETNKFDLCVRYFLNARKYNVVEDNIILDEYGLPFMGARA